MGRGSSSLPIKLKYQLYEDSVQCHEADIDFINDQYKKTMGHRPKTLREDFGGTAALACDWAKQSSDHFAYAIDLDDEPIAYGKENHYSRLTKSEQERMEYIKGNVLDNYDFSTDVIVAFNFSYFIFKKRGQLVEYFKQVKKGLAKNGMFFLDCFGGTESYEPLEEETEHDDHTYFWDLDKFNPVTNECLYYIHFKTHKDKKKHKKVFTYDWRMWHLIEIQEALEEAGFEHVHVYWEEDGDDGEGNGVYYKTQKEENCDSWVAYISAH